jgi:hypothetical protein
MFAQRRLLKLASILVAVMFLYVASIGFSTRMLWNELEAEAKSPTGFSPSRESLQRFYFSFYGPVLWIDEQMTGKGNYNHSLLDRYIRAWGVTDRVALGGGPG